MNSASSLSQQEFEWAQELVDEARRDLVFLWYITGSRWGGPAYQPLELQAAVSRVSAALIERGCIVGFGDPDSDSWRVPAELLVAMKEKGEVIARLWQKDPSAFEFLVFALRTPNP